MITIGQIESLNQSRLKRTNFNKSNNGIETSLLSDSYSENSKMSNLAFSQNDGTEVSFKGLNLYRSLFKPTVKIVPKNVSEKVFASLKNISKEQFSTYVKIKDDYLNFIKNNKLYREKFGITDEILSKLVSGGGETLIYLPQKTVTSRFLEQLVSPFTAIYKWGQKLLLPKNSQLLKKNSEQEYIVNRYRALDGLIKSHEIWENGYRKMLGHSKLGENGKFLIPDDVLYSKINRRRNKVVDPNRGKYSSNSLMIGNRLISGIIYSYFLGTDAYNTTMRYSNNKEEAAVQRKSRVAQEFSRIGMNMYIQNLLFGTFEAAVNKSLPTAMFVSGSTVACSEILGRKLVGKPIMPSNKAELDRREKEMANKKGLLPAIGRLLTNVKKKDNSRTQAKFVPVAKFASSNKANNALFSAFAKTNTSSNPNFKGLAQVNKFFKTEHFIEKELLARVNQIIKSSDEIKSKNIEETVLKALVKSPYLKQKGIVVPNTFEELLANDLIKQIPLGEKETLWGKFIQRN